MRHAITILTTPLLLTMCTTVAVAQAPEKTQTASVWDRSIDIHFAGGTLVAYLALVRERVAESGGGAANIVIDDHDGAERMTMPAVRLSGAALELSARLARGEGMKAASEFVVGPKAAIGSASRRTAVFLLRIQRLRTPIAVAPKADRELRVYSLKDVVAEAGEGDASKRVESILNAVEAALTLASGSSESPTRAMKYHVETGLLFVNGSAKENDVVQQIIQTLGASRREEGARKKLAELEAATADLNQQVVDRDRELATVAEVAKVREAALATEFEQLRSQFDRERAIRNELESKLRALEAQLRREKQAGAN